MIRNFEKIIILATIISSFLFSTPLLMAQATEAPNTGITYECVSIKNGVTVYGECGYNNLIQATKKALDKIFIFVLEFSVVVIAWVGFNFMISQGNPGKIKEARDMFLKVAKGIGFILAAWLIVNLIATALLSDDVIKLIPLNLKQ